MTDQTQQPGTALAPIQVIERDLAARITTFGNLLPSHIQPTRFQDVVLTALKRDPSLLDADRNSLFLACEEAANDGLLPDKKEGAFVIYNNKVKVRVGNGHATEDKWVKQVRWMPMIFGIRKKMFQAGVLEVIVELVYKNDFYQREAGDSGAIVHRPLDFGDRGPVIGGYAIIKTKDGGVFREVMSLEQIDAVERVSKSDSGPWKGPFKPEMQRKTILRRLAKQVPLSPEVERVVSRDDVFYDLPGDARAALVERQLPRAQVPHKALFSDKRHVAAPSEDVIEDAVIEDLPAEPAAAKATLKGKGGAKAKGKKVDAKKDRAKAPAPAAAADQDSRPGDGAAEEEGGEAARRAGQMAQGLTAAESLVDLGEAWGLIEAALPPLDADSLEWLAGVRDGRRKVLEAQAPADAIPQLQLILRGDAEPVTFEDPDEWAAAFDRRLDEIKAVHQEKFWEANKAYVLAGARDCPRQGQAIIAAMGQRGYDVEPSHGE